MNARSSRRVLAALVAVLGLLAASAGLAAAQDPPPSITLSGTIRDFRDTHPDFERPEATDRGIVRTELGADKKPVYAPAVSSPTTSGAAAFNQWYRDVPGVNLARPLDLEARLVPGSSPPTYRFASAAFFPIDDQLFGNQGRVHNYHFTYELHGRFTYSGGEVFNFAGDDDVWVFLNNRLVIDLGGIHTAQSASVALDAVAPSIGMEPGGSYDFDLFFAERRTAQSTFEFETTVTLEATDPSGAPPLRSGGETTSLGQPAGAVCAPVPPRRTSRKGSIRLSRQALTIQQRIDAAALRRLNAANAWIDEGVLPRDLCGNAFGPGAFQQGIAWTQSQPDATGPPSPRPLRIIRQRKPPARFTVDLRQVRINDRISRALLARAIATSERLSTLTGGNLADWERIGPRPRSQEPAPGAALPPSSEPNPTALRIGPLPAAGRLTLTAAQLRTTQRRSQRAIVLANRVNDRIRAGLTEHQFRTGSIAAGRIG